MTDHPRRRAMSEFWLLACLSALIVGGLAILLWAPWSGRSIGSGKSLMFYCAAGMAKPVEEIIADYRDRYGVEVQLIPEGSGQLLSKIRATHTGDLFLSADRYHMDKARKEGLVAEVIPVATLHPVLIVRTATQEKLKAQGKPVTGLKDLLRSDLHVVLANPELAAIGKTSKDALGDPKVALWPKLDDELKSHSSRVSTVGTVNEVVTAVRTGDGVIGIVWKSNAQQTPGLEIIAPPELTRYTELIQIGILTSASEVQATAALQFARFLSAHDAGLVNFTAHHFDVVPDADIWEVEPEIHLAAGAMLKPGIEPVIRAFEQREGVRIIENFAGCGLLVSNMKALKAGGKSGSFPDAYFACDTTFLDKVQQWFDAGVIVSANDLVLIVPRGNPKQIHGLEDLVQSNLRIGLADPQKTALGQLTDDLLKKTGHHGEVYSDGWLKAGRVVFSEAGHDLVNKMRVGTLDVAITYRSNALANTENVRQHMDIIDIDIPGALARQPFAIARSSPHRYLMQRLLQAIIARQSAEHFQKLGFRWLYDVK